MLGCLHLLTGVDIAPGATVLVSSKNNITSSSNTHRTNTWKTNDTRNCSTLNDGPLALVVSIFLSPILCPKS